jgi:thiamine transport system ATP-binding protein
VTGWVVQGLESDLGGFHLGPVDLELRPGSATAVLGASGAGKTTLLRALGGFLRTRPGRVLRDGVDITDWAPEDRGLGYVPQGLGLLPHRTVAHNVGYPLEIRGRPDAAARTHALLERFHLEGLARRYPARLSGGEQQRVAIARALAAEPGLIVWDEPWQGLDVLARHELGLALHDLRTTERVPMILVTHDPALAFSVADAFLVLRGGRVQSLTDATTLLRAPADAFAARFVGYENVLERTELESTPSGPLRAWLAERSGPDGLAFPTPAWPAPPVAGPLWSGKVRSARPAPGGLTIVLRADGLDLTLRVPPTAEERRPTLGDRLTFWIDPTSVLPLGVRDPIRRGS